MLHISPKSFLKSSSRLGDPWTNRWFGACKFVFELLCLLVADTPSGGSGRFARNRLIECSSCSSCVLARSCFDQFTWLFFIRRSLSDSPSGVAGQSARRGRSASVRRTVCCSRCTTGGSGTIFVRFATCSRTVRLVPADSLPPPCGRSAQAIADCLSPLLIEFCFRFGIVWGLLLGLVCPL
jgi:hypothetical protein